MAGPDPATTEWVPVWTPMNVGPVGPVGPEGPQGEQGIQGPIGPQGIQGIQGPVGEKWFSGTGVPSGTLTDSLVGDWYLNDANGDVYEKTGTTTWTLRDNLTGPQGEQGIQGIQGIQGPQGLPGATAAHAANHRIGGSDPLTNNAWTDAANVFTQDQEIRKDYPRIGWWHNLGSVDARLFRIYGNTGNLYISALNDAASAVQSTPITAFRNGEIGVGGAINFPAAQVASANANALDDYEEGTWTPLLSAEAGGTAIYNLQYGNYIKIGKLVHYTGRINISSKNTLSAGALYIGGFPFNSNNAYHPGVISHFQGLAVGMTWLGGMIYPSNVVFYLTNTLASQIGNNNIIISQITDNFDIMFAGSYIAAS
jgi:hypothetical protein